MKLYLDIEGTLIGSDGHPAKGAEDFLHYVTDMYECFWLSSHAKTAEDNPIRRIVTAGFSEDAVIAASKINSAFWNIHKIEAINLKEDFVWLDDSPSSADFVLLQKNNVFRRLYHIQLATNPYSLCEALEWLMSLEDEEVG